MSKTKKSSQRWIRVRRFLTVAQRVVGLALLVSKLLRLWLEIWR